MAVAAQEPALDLPRLEQRALHYAAKAGARQATLGERTRRRVALGAGGGGQTGRRWRSAATPRTCPVSPTADTLAAFLRDPLTRAVLELPQVRGALPAGESGREWRGGFTPAPHSAHTDRRLWRPTS